MLARILAIVGLAVVVNCVAPPAMAAEKVCEKRAGRVVSLQGRVVVRSAGESSWRWARLHETLCEGDTIRTGPRSRAAVALVNDVVTRLDEKSTLELENVGQKGTTSTLLRLLTGILQSFSRKPEKFSVATPAVTIGVRGTEFVFSLRDGDAQVTVLEGEVAASNASGQVAVASGETAVAREGQAPERRTVVRPRDQVQWSLYYPPVLSFRGGSLEGVPGAWPEVIAEALGCAERGDTVCAFETLERIPERDRGARFHLLNAALLLSVGRTEEAGADVDRALALDPNAGTALALRAVIAVATNDIARALTDATRAVTLSPDAVAPKIALSYAQQANLDLDGALDTLQQAVQQHPDDPLARARLAELWLSQGFPREAMNTAEEANRLAPDLSRTQLVLGYVSLARMNIETAKTVFQRAIELDSADPLARLGLGLAKIRQGDLEEGRQDIEAAVALDSNNAVLRSYLGKSYFEEKRDPLDAEQYAIARELDPNDPTPFLYSGILNQSINRPVEGLHDLQDSIERNDNRAVYRSRLLLDQDRAARGTSQARIYNNLGFQRLGINESRRSLALDPSSAGAHRFLSDTYRSLPRREAARVSELLQAQTLQDLNINPIQPSVSSSNLNIGVNGGPTSTGFDEYTPLFERNRAQLNVTAFGGSNDTIGGEAVLSGVYSRFSGSGGAYAYDSNGFRPNNDLRHRIYDVFGQVAITPELNVQLEGRRRETERGDLAMNFDPTSFDPNFRERRDEDSVRAAARYSPDARSDFVLSYIHSKRDVTGSTSSVQQQTGTSLITPPAPFVPIPAAIPFTATANGVTSNSQSDDADQFEGLYVFNTDRFNLAAGAAYSHVEAKGQSLANVSFNTVFATLMLPLLSPPFPPGTTAPFPVPPLTDTDMQTFSLDNETHDYRGYVYTNVDVVDSVTGTLGVSYQDFDSNRFRIDRFNPKVGLQWDATGSLRLRAAYFEGIKPVLASNRTLEPTQVAGFNQVFDDPDGTLSKRYGAALEWRINRNLSVGVEATGRWLESPVFNLTTGTTTFEDYEEITDRGYLYWTPISSLALSVEAVYDKFDKDISSPTATGLDRVNTLSVPVNVTYFHPSGLFGGVGASWVDQEVVRNPASTLASGRDDFIVMDLLAGWRLPRRSGQLSVVVKNVFGEEFNYQDDTYRTFQNEPTGTPFVPERTVMATFTLSL